MEIIDESDAYEGRGEIHLAWGEVGWGELEGVEVRCDGVTGGEWSYSRFCHEKRRETRTNTKIVSGYFVSSIHSCAWCGTTPQQIDISCFQPHTTTGIHNNPQKSWRSQETIAVSVSPLVETAHLDISIRCGLDEHHACLCFRCHLCRLCHLCLLRLETGYRFVIKMIKSTSIHKRNNATRSEKVRIYVHSTPTNTQE